MPPSDLYGNPLYPQIIPNITDIYRLQKSEEIPILIRGSSPSYGARKADPPLYSFRPPTVEKPIESKETVKECEDVKIKTEDLAANPLPVTVSNSNGAESEVDNELSPVWKLSTQVETKATTKPKKTSKLLTVNYLEERQGAVSPGSGRFPKGIIKFPRADGSPIKSPRPKSVAFTLDTSEVDVVARINHSLSFTYGANPKLLEALRKTAEEDLVIIGGFCEDGLTFFNFDMGATGSSAIGKARDSIGSGSGKKKGSRESDGSLQVYQSSTQQAQSRVVMDEEIQETVESLLGKGVKVVDCEKKSCLREEEVLLVNGIPIALEGADGAAIRDALLSGNVPHCDLLNQILIRAGILRAPVRLETSLSVKSTVVTREEVTVARGGKVVDERSRETQEDNFYTSSSSEVWEPAVPGEPKPPGVGEQYYIPFKASEKCPGNDGDARKFFPLRGGGCGSTTSTSSVGSDEVDHAVRTGMSGLLINGVKPSNGYIKVPGVPATTSDPTICGSVNTDANGKDSRRSLPQTPQVSKTLLNGSSPVPSHDLGSVASAGPSDTVSISDNVLAYTESGTLISGPLEALVQHMVPTADYYPDRAYLFAFLLSSRLFIKPHELLGEVCALCDSQQNLSERHQPSPKDRVIRFVPHLVQLLAEWTETFPYDFRDERVMVHVRGLTQKCVTVEPGVRKEVSLLLQNLLHRLTTLEKYEEYVAKVNGEAAIAVVDRLNSLDVSEMCPCASLLAQQLTHIELERLSYIGPEEFVQSFAKDNPQVETSAKEVKKTRNLENYVAWFNRLSYFVATEVCKQTKKKQRVKMIDYWIEVARECFNIGNFNSLMSIIAGLNISPVSRLKKSWHKAAGAKFSALEHQMDPSSNFGSYRSTLKAAVWRAAGAADERQRIVVPFFSLLVKDLYFLNEGCSNRLPNGHINFEKFWQLAKQVTEFIAWKQVTCPFERNAKVIAYLQSTPVWGENALALASYECEAPDNSSEKERYKQLKAELHS